MSDITYQAEPWSKCLPEMMGLWTSHWAEVGSDTDKFDFDPDLDRYAELERSEKLHVVTARRFGELVGYFVWIIGTSLHHRTIRNACSDGYWLHPDCRKGMQGLGLIKEAERSVRELGVKKLFSTYQSRLDLDPIYSRLGWQAGETVRCKYVG